MTSEDPLLVYADATALIGLARIGRLDLLILLHTPVRVTAYVWTEVASDRERPGSSTLMQARDAGLLTVVDEGDPRALSQLDAGESTVLTAAAAARAAVLVDERAARALIETDPQLRGSIQAVTGIIGLILLAKHRGSIESVRPLLDALRAQSFWIAPALYERVLRQVEKI